jgi:hypothetical protein
MIRMWRLAKDEFLYSPDQPGSTQNWYLEGTEDETDIPAQIEANVPVFDAWDNPRIDATAKHVGGGTWIIAVRFGAIPPLATGLTLWDVDTTGGKEKRFQAIETVTFASSDDFANELEIENDGAIGVTESGIEGVDCVIPKISLKAKRKFKTSDLPSDYLDSLEQLTGRTNEAAFDIVYWGQIYAFEIGELLFMGGVVSIATETELEVDCTFEGSRDRLTADANGLNLQGFTAPISKAGWDYIWFQHHNATSNGMRTKKVRQANVDRVYDKGDFTVLIL